MNVAQYHALYEQFPDIISPNIAHKITEIYNVRVITSHAVLSTDVISFYIGGDYWFSKKIKVIHSISRQCSKQQCDDIIRWINEMEILFV